MSVTVAFTKSGNPRPLSSSSVAIYSSRHFLRRQIEESADRVLSLDVITSTLTTWYWYVTFTFAVPPLMVYIGQPTNGSAWCPVHCANIAKNISSSGLAACVPWCEGQAKDQSSRKRPYICQFLDVSRGSMSQNVRKVNADT
jgi:hypothetical protein